MVLMMTDKMILVEIPRNLVMEEGENALGSPKCKKLALTPHIAFGELCSTDTMHH